MFAAGWIPWPGYLERCSTSDPFKLRSEDRKGAQAFLRGLLPNWKVAAVAFRENHPGTLLVPSPEPAGIPEAGYHSPAGLQYPASPGPCEVFIDPFVLSFGRDMGTPALEICCSPSSPQSTWSLSRHMCVNAARTRSQPDSTALC